MSGAVLVDVGVKDTVLKLVRGRNSERAAAFVSVPAQNANAVRSFLEPRPNLLLKWGRRFIELCYVMNAALQAHFIARCLDCTISCRDGRFRFGDLRHLGAVLSLKGVRRDQIVP